MRSRHPFAALALAATLAVPAAAQTIEYTLETIDPVPGASSTVGTGMNDLGHVVGWSQFFDGSPSLQPWLWTPEDGTTLLPIPPGLDIARAIDINDAGVITGDGGFDSGQAWRLEDGVAALLGTLPETSVSTAAAINEAGEIAGTSRNPSITFAPKAFLDVPDAGMSLVFDGAWATFLNDVGQIVGYTSNPIAGSNQAWRFTPGVGVELLGPLGSKPLNWATSINTAGDVVGWASQANGNGDVPFLFTDEGGMQEIGDFGGATVASDVNDAREVIGVLDTGVAKPWIWTEQDGVRFLGDLIDPSLDLNLLDAVRINTSGQILARGFDNTVVDMVTVVLTPVGDPWTDLGFALAGTAGDPVLSPEGTLAAGDPVSLSLTNALRDAPAFLTFGLERLDLPFKGGVLVPAFSPPAGVLLAATTDAAGSLVVGAPWPAGFPSGQSVFAQVWIADDAGPAGFAASNAVEGIVP